MRPGPGSVRRLVPLLLLVAGLAFAQGKDDEGITIDEAPSGPEEEPSKPTGPVPARTPGKKVETVVVKKKTFSIALPKDWGLAEGDDPKAEVAWDVRLPGSTKGAGLFLYRDEGGDPRSMPYYREEWFKKEKPDANVEIRTKTIPRIVLRQSTDEGERVNCFFWVSVRNNAYGLQLSCSAEDFPQAETDMLAAVRSFTAEVELWPAIPKGYQISEEGIWLVARAPDVTAPLAPLLKVLKDTEKRFRRDHGALPKDASPLVVLVHTSKAAAEKIEPQLASTQNDFTCIFQHRRMFAVPFGKDQMEEAGMATATAAHLLFFARYGDSRPDWIANGEGTVARAEFYTGKQLPSLDEGFVGWVSSLSLHTLDELEKLRESGGDTWSKEAFFYVAALREGKYKKHYKAFLDDLSATGDAMGAFARHLGTIDQGELRDSTNKFLTTRITPEKRKS